MSTLVPQGEALRDHYQSARAVNSRAYCGFRIDTVNYGGPWHIFLYAPESSEPSQIVGNVDESVALKDARWAIDCRRRTFSGLDTRSGWVC